MKKENTSRQNFLPIMLSGAFLLIATFTYRQMYSQKPSNYFFSKKSESVLEIKMPEEFRYNQKAEIQIDINTLGKTVNAVKLGIKYDPLKLKFVNFDTAESFCQFYPEKKVNESTGEIKLSCGSPKPGFSGQNTLANLQFLPIQVGVTNIVVEDTSMILLSDGKGTNVLNTYPEKSINIVHNL